MRPSSSNRVWVVRTMSPSPESTCRLILIVVELMMAHGVFRGPAEKSESSEKGAER